MLEYRSGLAVHPGLLSAVVIAAASPMAIAQEVTSGWTLAALLDRISHEDPRLLALEARVATASAELEGASVLSNPSIAWEREEVFLGGTGQSDDFIRLDWPLDVSGRRGFRVQAARAGVEAARASVSAQRTELLLDAALVLVETARRSGRVDVVREAADAIGALVEAQRRRERAGDVAGYDVERLELELAVLRSDVAEAEADREEAERALGQLVGEASAAADPAVLLPSAAVPAPDALAAGALETRGDVSALSWRARQAEGERGAAERAWVPQLALTGGAKISDTGPDLAWGYVVGLGIELPFFGRGQAERAHADAALAQAKAESAVLERAIPLRVRAAHAALERRRGLLDAFAAGPAARLPELMRRAEAAWREGERPVSEVLDAHRTARDARLRLLEARAAVKRAEIELHRAAGRLP